MGRKQLNHVQYKRNIHPDFVSTMDKTLNKLKQEKKSGEFINNQKQSDIMITTTPITQSFEFESLQKGDYLACEFHQNVHDYPKVYRFKIFQIVKVRIDTKEIILQTKNNIYFNYEMYVNGDSNLKSAVLITQKP